MASFSSHQATLLVFFSLGVFFIQQCSAYSPMDINGSWDWECSDCYGFPSCKIETVYVGATQRYTYAGVCTAVDGTQSAIVQEGDFHIQGDFLALSVTDFSPKKRGNDTLYPPFGGSFSVLSVSPTRLDFTDRLSNKEFYMTCNSNCGRSLKSGISEISNAATRYFTEFTNATVATDSSSTGSSTNPASNIPVIDATLPINPGPGTTVTNPTIIDPIGVGDKDINTTEISTLTSGADTGVRRRVTFLLFLVAAPLMLAIY